MKYFAVLGESLKHTKSPEIHRQIYRHINLNHSYGILNISKENFGNLKDILKENRYSGINVTIPYKETIIPSLNYISPEANYIGAVNTVRIDDGILSGYNTDYYGFGAMLDRHNIIIKDRNIIIFGSGGSAKAVIAYLLNNNVKSIYVNGRNNASLSFLKNKFPEITICHKSDLNKLNIDIAVNCTPVGMYPNVCESIADEAIIKSFDTLVDLVYNPQETKYLLTGKALGKKIAGGLYMLIEQAIKADEIFFGVSIDKSIGEKIYASLSIPKPL